MDKENKTESAALGGCENKAQDAAELVQLLAGLPEAARTRLRYMIEGAALVANHDAGHGAA